MSERVLVNKVRLLADEMKGDGGRFENINAHTSQDKEENFEVSQGAVGKLLTFDAFQD